MDTDKFIQATVGVVICVIVAVAVAIPIISGMTMGESATFANKSIVNTILGVVPIFIVIGIMVGVVAIMKSRRD